MIMIYYNDSSSCLDFFLMIPVQEPKREFQSQHFESRRPEGREGNRQRRKRELIFGFLWDIDFWWFLLVPVLVPCSFIFYVILFNKLHQNKGSPLCGSIIFGLFFLPWSPRCCMWSCISTIFFSGEKHVLGSGWKGYWTHLLQTPLPYRGFSWHFVGRF